ncbi:MAG: hypothetical protein AAB699_01270 [Patescibacteria group bacterium]
MNEQPAFTEGKIKLVPAPELTDGTPIVQPIEAHRSLRLVPQNLGKWPVNADGTPVVSENTE